MSLLTRLATCFVFVSLLAHGQSDLDATVARALAQFHVPGMAVGVIQDGRVLVSKGYGVRKTGEAAPVTDQTLFQIASNSKAFTAASLAILVDEKKISWDDRVVDVLPEFQMSDAYVTREMRIRDLLCHRSGLALGAGDLMVFPDDTLPVHEFLRHLRHVPLAASFRSRYAYDNVLYTVAGAVIEKVSGQPWNLFLQSRIFQQLGMTGSRPRAQDLQPGENVATPHVFEDGRLETVPLAHLSAGAPAGAICSSVSDLLKWVNVQLHEGEYPGGHLFSAKQSAEMWTPEIFVPIPEKYPPELAALRPNFQAYGLGWFLYEYHGERIVYHTGGLAGMVTRVTLIPAKKLGIVVLTNQEDGGAFQSVTLSILDHYFGLEPHDWVRAYEAVETRRKTDAKESVAKASAHRDVASKPSLPLDKYCGRYRDPWYGDIQITKENGGLAMQFTHSPDLHGTLEHFQYDTFIVRWRERALDADAYLTFALNPDGSIREAKMAEVSPLTDFSFDFHDLELKPVGADTAPF